MINLKSKAGELKELQTKYLLAKAEDLATKQIGEDAKNKVLQRQEFFEEDTGKRILDCKRDFLMSEEQFTLYLKLAHEERLKMGLGIPSYELTSDYFTDPILLKAEEELIDFTISIMPKKYHEDFVKVKKNWKTRPEMTDLALKLEL